MKITLWTRTGLRSASDTTRLTVPRTVRTLKYAANRSFIHVAPRRNLSHSLKTFENSSVSKVPLVHINFVSISCFSCCYIIVYMYFLCLMRHDLDGAALY